MIGRSLSAAGRAGRFRRPDELPVGLTPPQPVRPARRPTVAAEPAAAPRARVARARAETHGWPVAPRRPDESSAPPQPDGASAPLAAKTTQSTTCTPGESFTTWPAERQLVGEFAEAVQRRIRERLADQWPGYRWDTEHRIGSTPVDVAGRSADHLVAVELEWRRADPADNTAKLFRHLERGSLDDYDRVVVVQVFTAYYDLSAGGVSSKRKNAEFVGEVAEQALARVSYHAVDFDLDPPKRGGDWPDGWRGEADETADRISETL